MSENPRLRQEFLLSLGSIAVNHQALFASVRHFIIVLTEVKYTIGCIMTERMRFAEAVNTLEALCSYRLHNHAGLPQLRALLTRIRELNAMRNRFVHAMWSDSSSGGTPTILEIARDKKTERVAAWGHRVGADELTSIADGLEGAHAALAATMASLMPPELLERYRCPDLDL